MTEAGTGGTDPARQHVAKVTGAVASIAQPIVASFGLEIDRVEFRTGPHGAVLQVFIDKPGGVTVEDCARVSRQLSAELDVDDVVPGAYDLEVSSPGLDRPLKGEADFAKFAGRLAAVTFRKAVEGTGSKAVGRLGGIENGAVILEFPDGRVVRVPVDQIAKARLEPEP